MRVRVSTRGVRTSLGPRAARVNFGSGRTTVSTGVGPFYAWTGVGGGRRGARRRRSGPSPAQIARAQQAAIRAEEEKRRLAAIQHLGSVLQEMVSVHRETFPAAQRPVPPPPPALTPKWAIDAARAHHESGIGMFARSERKAARGVADQLAPQYLAAEQRRLQGIHQQLQSEADRYWTALRSNDEDTVIETVNEAFADNPASGCAVGVEDGVLSVLMRQPDITTLPEQKPSVTPAGRPTLKTMTKTERTVWWWHSLASNAIATCKEAFAVAPAIQAVDLAVVTHVPGSNELGVVAYGQWTRETIEKQSWPNTGDLITFFECGQGVVTSLRLTKSGNVSTAIRPLDIGAVPALRELVANAEDSAMEDVEAELEASARTTQGEFDPYVVQPYAEWLQRSGADRQVESPVPQPVHGFAQPSVSVSPPVPAKRVPPAQGASDGGGRRALMIALQVVTWIWAAFWLLAVLGATVNGDYLPALFVAVIFVAVPVYLVLIRPRARRRRRLEDKRRAALAARAIDQNNAYMSGDPSGLYGEYRPHPLE